jgi:hypothetical protein
VVVVDFLEETVKCLKLLVVTVERTVVPLDLLMVNQHIVVIVLKNGQPVMIQLQDLKEMTPQRSEVRREPQVNYTSNLKH